MKHKKHLFFDMDDTVTASRTPMEDDIYEFYASLPHNIIIVSGAHIHQIGTQVCDLPFFRLGQNGNQAIDPDGHMLWEEKISDEHSQAVTDHIGEIKKRAALSVQNEDDLVEYRGAQISYSLIGHNEELEKKKACDPDKQLRRLLLGQMPFTHEHIEVKIGGTTCLDYFHKGKHKGHNVKRLIEHMGWNPDDAIYFGDALFPGGNDEAVIGVIDTVQVDNHRHTYEILKDTLI